MPMRRPFLILAILFVAGPAVALGPTDGFGSAGITHDIVEGVAPLTIPTTTERAAASLSTKQDGTKLRATVMPLEFFPTLDYFNVWSEWRLTAQADTSTNLTRVATSFGYNPFNRRGSRAQDVFKAVVAQKNCGQYPPVSPQMKQCNDEVMPEYVKELNSSWRPQLTLGVAFDFFPGGQTQDKNDPTKLLSSEWWGGPHLQFTAANRPIERLSLELGLEYKHTRPSGDAATVMANYYSGSLTISGIVIPFLPDAAAERAKNESYISEGYLPGIALGASFQGFVCTSAAASCDKTRTKGGSVTPFVDVRVNPKLQLQFSIPVSWYDANANGAQVGPVLSVAGGFSGG